MSRGRLELVKIDERTVEIRQDGARKQLTGAVVPLILGFHEHLEKVHGGKGEFDAQFYLIGLAHGAMNRSHEQLHELLERAEELRARRRAILGPALDDDMP